MKIRYSHINRESVLPLGKDMVQIPPIPPRFIVGGQAFLVAVRLAAGAGSGAGDRHDSDAGDGAALCGAS